MQPPAQRTEFLTPSWWPASSNASLFEAGISDHSHRWYEQHTIRIAWHALNILQLWVTWTASDHDPRLIVIWFVNPTCPAWGIIRQSDQMTLRSSCREHEEICK